MCLLFSCVDYVAIAGYFPQKSYDLRLLAPCVAKTRKHERTQIVPFVQNQGFSNK